MAAAPASTPVALALHVASNELCAPKPTPSTPHLHPQSRAHTPPPPSITPPPPSNTCTHYQSLALATLHQRFRHSKDFLDLLASSNQSLLCNDCHRLVQRKDLWICLECHTGHTVRCGRTSDSACALDHAKLTRHGLVMNIETRMIWCYFEDSEVIDELGRSKAASIAANAILPQQIRHCIDNSDPISDSDEDRMTDAGNDNGGGGSGEDDEDENMTWHDYYSNSKGGEVGLSNLGNTCFMNAALQSLVHCPPLIAFLSEMSHIPMNDIRQRLIADFSAFIQKTWSGHYSLIVPGDLYRDLIFINPFFRGYGQHDSQELTRCLLDQMHEGLKICEQYDYLHYQYGHGTGEEQEQLWKEQLEQEKLFAQQRLLAASSASEGKGKKKDRKAKKEKSASEMNGHHTISLPQSQSQPQPTPIESQSQSQPQSESMKKKKKIWPDHSIISDTFMGLLESRIRCHQCNTISTVHDQFHDLSLEIPKESNMKRIAAERGTEAMTPAGKQSWLGSLLTYTGLVPAPLSLETCIVENTPVLVQHGLQRAIQLIQPAQSLIALRTVETRSVVDRGLIDASVRVGPRGINQHIASNCVRIITATGRSLECTDDHRIAVKNTTGHPAHTFVQAKSLVSSQYHQLNGNEKNRVDQLVCGPGGAVDNPNNDEPTELGWQYAFAADTIDALRWQHQPVNHSPNCTHRDRCLAFARIVGFVCARGFTDIDQQSCRATANVSLYSRVDCQEWQRDVFAVCGQTATVAERDPSNAYYDLTLPQPLTRAIVSLHGWTLGQSPFQLPSLFHPSRWAPPTPRAMVREFLAGLWGAAGIPPVHFSADGSALMQVRLLMHSTDTDMTMKERLTSLELLSKLAGVRANVITFAKLPGSFTGCNVNDCYGDQNGAYHLADTDSSSRSLVCYECRIDNLAVFMDCVSFRYAVNKQLRLAVAREWLAYQDATKHCTDSTTASQYKATHLANTTVQRRSTFSAFLRIIGLPSLFDEFDELTVKPVSACESAVPVYYLPVIRIEPMSGSYTVHDLTMNDSANNGTHNFVANSVVVHNCLHAFCTSDRLIASDQYRCDQCKVKVDASKTLSIQRLPEVLMLHIKRFAHNNYFGLKLNRHVNFTVSGLDMRPFLSDDARASMSEDGVDSTYDLFAIIRHLGGAGGGHYIAYCKNHVTNKWYEFDDRIVTEISEKKLNEIEAYVLFYRRNHSDRPAKLLLDRVQQAVIQKPVSGSGSVRFLSREYLKRITVFNRVEPLDNRDLLCVHGVPYQLPDDGGSLAVPLTVDGWNQLIVQHGGGPIVDGKHYECAACLLPFIRQRERKRISHLDSEASIHSSPTDPFYLIHDDWLKQWRAFIAGSDQRPGPIANHLLLDEHGQPRAGLQKVKDYRGLHGTVWEELLRCYGGGPTIVRDRLDIYSTPATPTATILVTSATQHYQQQHSNGDEPMAPPPHFEDDDDEGNNSHESKENDSDNVSDGEDGDHAVSFHNDPSSPGNHNNKMNSPHRRHSRHASHGQSTLTNTVKSGGGAIEEQKQTNGEL